MDSVNLTIIQISKLIKEDTSKLYTDELQEIITSLLLDVSELITPEVEITSLSFKKMIFERLDRYLSKISDIEYKINPKQKNSSLILSGLNHSNESLDNMKCYMCNIGMSFIPDFSCYMCRNCGLEFVINGTIIQDIPTLNDVIYDKKTGSFSPKRHAEVWLNCILAREPIEEIGSVNDPHGEKLIQTIREMSYKYGYILQLLTIKNIREFLVTLGKTELNKHIPLILVNVTGIEPPILSDDIYKKAILLFVIAIQVRSKIKKHTYQKNRNYYPYYLIKILEQVISKDNIAERKILEYIHIQDWDTTAMDDLEWYDICKFLPIEYKPTIHIR